MVDITAALVKELRDATNVSMMECKRSLVESEGDIEKATRVLRERGMAVAAKKASRATNQGLIASATADDGKSASLVQVNCETDFVARNDGFKAFVAELAGKALEIDSALGEELKDEIVAKVAEIGENIVIPGNTRFVQESTGLIQSYIHLGGKVGVLIEVGCEKAETLEAPAFKELAKDLSLHVAACNPQYLTSDEVPDEDISSEKEIFAKQVEDKPAEIIDRIVDGKIKKYFGEICLVDQGFVKEPKQSVTDLLAETGKQVGDEICIRRFVRYQLGQ
jgi:elongation factor Ts